MKDKAKMWVKFQGQMCLFYHQHILYLDNLFSILRLHHKP